MAKWWTIWKDKIKKKKTEQKNAQASVFECGVIFQSDLCKRIRFDLKKTKQLPNFKSYETLKFSNGRIHEDQEITSFPFREQMKYLFSRRLYVSNSCWPTSQSGLDRFRRHIRRGGNTDIFLYVEKPAVIEEQGAEASIFSDLLRD